MINNDYAQAIREGRMRIQIDLKKQPDGEYAATYTDVNGKTVGHIHQDQNEAARRCNDKAVDGIIDGSLQVQR